MKEEQTKLVVQVQPNAAKNEVLGFREGVLHIKIAAPPVKGKANKELVKYLGSILGIAKSRVVIQKGTTSRMKHVSIEGLDRQTILSFLQPPAHRT